MNSLPVHSVAIVLGTRPELIKLEGLDQRFAAHPPRAVVVQGDTNAALTGALAANARDLPLVHVEAGLRSHDRTMPEEHNRVLVDRLADLLCAATPDNRGQLLAEGIPDERITVTGNTVVEAVQSHIPSSERRARILADHGLSPDGYVLATVHRPENTDDPAVLAVVLGELAGLARDVPVVFPLHPRTRSRIETAGLLPLVDELTLLPPTEYDTFLALAHHAALIVSDSGGVQEETTVLGRPLVVVRRSTERSEAFTDFAELVGPGLGIGAAARRRLAEGPEGRSRLACLPSPYGDGAASLRIADLIVTTVGPDHAHATAPPAFVPAGT